MTFDYPSTWKTKTGSFAPLYGSGNSVDQTIKYWISKIGSNKKKLLMGIPLYGAYWNLTSSSTAIGAPAKFAGTMPYNQICDKLENGWTRVLDMRNNLSTSYAYGDKKWVSYDDSNIIRNKIDYVKSKQIGGMFIWTMDFDDFCECLYVD